MRQGRGATTVVAATGMAQWWLVLSLVTLGPAGILVAASVCQDTEAVNNNQGFPCQYETVLDEFGDWYTLKDACTNSTMGYSDNRRQLTLCYEEMFQNFPPLNLTRPNTCASGNGQNCQNPLYVAITSWTINRFEILDPENKIIISSSACTEYQDLRLLGLGLGDIDLKPWRPMLSSPNLDLYFPNTALNTNPLESNTVISCALASRGQGSSSDVAGDKWIEVNDENLVALKTASTYSCPYTASGKYLESKCLSKPCVERENSFSISTGGQCTSYSAFPFDSLKVCAHLQFQEASVNTYQDSLRLTSPMLYYEFTEELYPFTNYDGSTTMMGRSMHSALSNINLGGTWDPPQIYTTLSVNEAHNKASYRICFEAQRNMEFYIARFFLPPFLLTTVSISVTWLGHKSLAPRLAACMVAMLTVLNSRKDIEGFMPKYNENTFYDVYILLCTWAIMTCALESTLVFAVRDNSRWKGMKLVHRFVGGLELVMRIALFPVWFGFIIVLKHSFSPNPYSGWAIAAYVLVPIFMWIIPVACLFLYAFRLPHWLWELARSLTKRKHRKLRDTDADVQPSVVTQEEAPFSLEDQGKGGGLVRRAPAEGKTVSDVEANVPVVVQIPDAQTVAANTDTPAGAASLKVRPSAVPAVPAAKPTPAPAKGPAPPKVPPPRAQT